MRKDDRKPGMIAAMLTPISMGIIPIFAKLSINAGMDAFTVAALRTVIAAILLWLIFLVFARKYIFIFPAGILGTLAVGVTNGLGSLLYYNGLEMINNASLAQLLFLQYSVFTIILSLFMGEKISWLSIFRCILAFIAVIFLTLGNGGNGSLKFIGVILIIGGAFLYALHVIISQRVMFEMPAPTMTLYAMTWMGLTVLIARIIAGQITPLSWEPTLPSGWLFLLGLSVMTGFSRLSLFTGVRGLGSLQTILLNMADLGVTLVLARFFLNEFLSVQQWIGVALLVISVLLSNWEKEDGAVVYKPIPNPRRHGSK